MTCHAEPWKDWTLPTCYGIGESALHGPAGSYNSLNMNRRQFLAVSAAFAARRVAAAEPASISFSCDNARLQKIYDDSLAALAANVLPVDAYSRPVLFEGATYGGIWLECGPLESLAYAPVSMAAARASHEIFFDLQREDGYIPCWFRPQRTGSAQIQMVVPIAATAWELYGLTRESAFLEKAYRACSRWDEWLMRYRDTRKTGLCEAFCEYDTGHDNSPRFEGKPKACPNSDARECAKVEGLPFLAPDLSATVYGGRIAMAAMAGEMGRAGERARWLESAEKIRRSIMERLYEPRDAAFYDRDASDKFVRVRGDAITRVMGEQVPERAVFEEVWRRQLHNPNSFWTPFPFPSIAVDDPKFIRPTSRNSWGGASQALTALRTPRWMEHYGKYSAWTHLARQWVAATLKSGQFLQQVDPWTGEASVDRAGYSPAALVLFGFTHRLHGVVRSGERLEWNCRLPEGTARCTATLATPRGEAKIDTTAAKAVLSLAGKALMEVTGEARVVTGLDGSPVRLIGTGEAAAAVKLRRGGKEQSWKLAPDQEVALRG
jgi:hypothetical protein